MRGGVLALGPEVGAAMLADVDGGLQRVVGALVVVVLRERGGEQHPALDAMVLVLRAREVAPVEIGGLLVAAGVLVRLAHLEDHLVGVGGGAILREEAVAVGDGLVVLAGRDAQDHRVVGGVLGVLVLLVVRVIAIGEARDGLVELRGLGEEAHRLEGGGRDPRSVRRLGLGRIRLAGDELRAFLQGLGVAGFLRLELGVDARLRGAGIVRELLRRAKVSARRVAVLAGCRLLLALLEDRLDDERVELLLVRVARERRRALEAPRPGLDVLVVLGAVERVEDQLAGRERVLAARELLEERPPDLHRRVVDAVVVVLAPLPEEELGKRGVGRIELRVELEGLRELLVSLGLLERAASLTYALLPPPLELAEAHLLEGGDGIVDGVVTLRLERLGERCKSLVLGHGARRGHVLGRRGVAFVEVMEVDLAQIIMNLVRAFFGIELG